MKKFFQKLLYSILSVVCSDSFWLLVLLCAELYFMYIMQPQPCHAAPAAQNITIGVDVGTGYGGVLGNNVYSYLEPFSTTCQFGGSRQVVVPVNTTNFVVDTGTLFSGFAVPVALGLADTTASPGVKLNVGMASSGPRIHLAPRGFFYTRTASGFPVFYVDNPSLTQPAVVQVFMLGN